LLDGLLHIIHGFFQLFGQRGFVRVRFKGNHNQPEGMGEALFDVFNKLVQGGELPVFHIHGSLVAAAGADAGDNPVHVPQLAVEGFGIRAVEMIGVFAVLLHIIERPIRPAIGFHISVVGGAHRQPGGNRGGGGFHVGVLLLLKIGDDVFDPVFRRVLGEILHEAKEFVPAQAAANAALAVGRQRVAQEAKRLIPGLMAVGIVDFFQIV
jgi:hypothetical protein